MRFSVVIPAYNEAIELPATLAALQKQTVSRDAYEIIVADNNSTDQTSVVAREHGADQVILETEKGTNMARARGAASAQGDIIAFLDADCIAPPSWLSHIEQDLKKSGVAAVSGPFDYGFTGVARLLDRVYTRFGMQNISALLYFVFRKRAGVIVGGNFALWRQVIPQIGGFPKLAFWDDDAAIAMLVSRRVGKVLFDPILRVKSSPRRFERDGFLRLALRYFVAYFKIYFDRSVI